MVIEKIAFLHWNAISSRDCFLPKEWMPGDCSSNYPMSEKEREECGRTLDGSLESEYCFPWKLNTLFGVGFHCSCNTVFNNSGILVCALKLGSILRFFFRKRFIETIAFCWIFFFDIIYTNLTVGTNSNYFTFFFFSWNCLCFCNITQHDSFMNDWCKNTELYPFIIEDIGSYFSR